MYCCEAANSYAICSFRRSTNRGVATAPPLVRGVQMLVAGDGHPEAQCRLQGVSTCLVTGGAGFLGSHLCEELLARGHRVICVDNLETGSLANIHHIRSDQFAHLNIDIIEPYYVEESIDFVFHLASPASPIDYLR